MNFSQVTFECGVKILRKIKEICEKCPRMQKGICPNGNVGCVARENKMRRGSNSVKELVLSLRLQI